MHCMSLLIFVYDLCLFAGLSNHKAENVFQHNLFCLKKINDA